jgi:hypothetical protein
MFETEELAREEVERVGLNQSIRVLELRGFRDRGAGQGGGGEGGIQSINPCFRATRRLRQRREKMERVGSNQSIPVLELRGVRDRGTGQGGGGEGWDSINQSLF